MYNYIFICTSILQVDLLSDIQMPRLRLNVNAIFKNAGVFAVVNIMEFFKNRIFVAVANISELIVEDPFFLKDESRLTDKNTNTRDIQSFFLI